VTPTNGCPTNRQQPRQDGLDTFTGGVTAMAHVPLSFVLRAAHGLRRLLHMLAVALGNGTVWREYLGSYQKNQAAASA
jgi:hypothetical protein